jgi:hypothetical protein
MVHTLINKYLMWMKPVDAGPNLDRSMQIRQHMDKALYVYQHTYEGLKKEETVQSTLLKYFERQ